MPLGSPKKSSWLVKFLLGCKSSADTAPPPSQDPQKPLDRDKGLVSHMQILPYDFVAHIHMGLVVPHRPGHMYADCAGIVCGDDPICEL